MRNTMAKIIEDGLTAFQAALIEAAALVAECKATELDNLADNSAEIKFTRDYRAGARTARAIATDIRALKQPI